MHPGLETLQNSKFVVAWNSGTRKVGQVSREPAKFKRAYSFLWPELFRSSIIRSIKNTRCWAALIRCLVNSSGDAVVFAASTERLAVLNALRSSPSPITLIRERPRLWTYCLVASCLACHAIAALTGNKTTVCITAGNCDDRKANCDAIRNADKVSAASRMIFCRKS